METLGFVGLGKMGGRMAARLCAAGHPLVVNDVSPDAIASLQEAGARIAKSPREAADQADIVFASLPTPAIVGEVLTGDAGLLNGTRCELVVDLSTTGSEVAADAARQLERAGKAMLDAPVSGGISGAEAGTLAIMCSGPRLAYDRALPLLDILSRQTFYLGPKQGAAQTMKLVNQVLYFSSLSTAMEALVLASKAGLDPAAVVDVVNASSGRSWSSENRLKQAVLSGADAGAFIGSACKDLRLALDEALAHQAPMLAGIQALHQWSEALTRLGAGADIARALEVFEARARHNLEEARPSSTPASADQEI